MEVESLLFVHDALAPRCEKEAGMAVAHHASISVFGRYVLCIPLEPRGNTP